MEVVTIPTLKLLIEHVAINLREPIMIWGQPGAGKSEAIAQVAADRDDPLVDIRLSQYDSVDLRGIPVPSGELTVWHAPATLPFKGNPAFNEDEGLIFLFLDEINAAAPAVSAVAYQLINDRAVGEHSLMNNVVILAAGNREGDRGVTNRMPTPLANRFTHVEVEVEVDAWCYWAQENGVPPVGIAFMQFRKDMLSQFDPTSPNKAFATPRTWIKAFKYYEAGMPADVLYPAMTGAVGAGPAAEFHAFVDIWQKITPIETILKDPEGVDMPKEAAMKYAMSVSVSGAMDNDTIDDLHTYMERMDPEFVVLAWQLALKRDPMLAQTSTFSKRFSKRFMELFRTR